MDQPLSIVLTGPESTGKSDLCQALCLHFNIPLHREYARYYLEKYGPTYSFRDFKKMYQGHLLWQEEQMNRSKQLVILDTDSINYLVWARRVYGEVPDFIKRQLANENHHHYLLTYPDLNWQPDPLRENPAGRLEIFHEHRQEIEKLQRHYRIIKEKGTARTANAIRAVEKFLGFSKS